MTTEKQPATEEKVVEKYPITEGNLRIYRYLNRNRADQKLVEWSIEIYLHQKSNSIGYHTRWEKLMDAVEEIEKDENVSNVTVSGKGTVVKFKNNHAEDIFVKVGAGTDKKQACWKTIIDYISYIESNKKKKKKSDGN